MKHLFLVLALLSIAPVAQAQGGGVEFPSERARRSAILWQARSFIGEIGWHDVSTWVAMAQVHIEISERTGVPFERVVRQFSAAVKPEANTHRPWLFELDWSGRRPSMMRYGSWEAWRRERWFAALSIAADVIDGRLASHCYGARSYGGAIIDQNPNPETLERRDCLPGSGQAFWFWKREYQ